MVWYLLSQSRAWNRFVATTRGSSLRFFTISFATLGVFYVVGSYVVQATNPDYENQGSTRKDEELAKLPLDQQVLARANRQRLKELLLDIQEGKDGDRYAAALRGEVLGSNPAAHPTATYGTGKVPRS